MAVEEPGLDEAQLVVLLTRADRRLEPEFLAASGEVGRIEQVEVSLRHAHVAEKLIDRAEAGAKIKIARRPFFNVHDQIFQVRHFRRLHAHLDFALGRGEILQTFQTLLAQLDANHVEHFARRHGQFAPDDFVFRLGVAPDFNLLDFRRLAFINLVNQVHRAPVSVGVFDGPDHNPVPLTFANVTVGAIKVLNRLAVFFQPLRRKNFSFKHARFDRMPEDDHALPDLFGREPGVAFELDRTDLVTLAFINDEADDQARRAGVVQLHFFDFEINVAFAPVKILQLLLVLLKLLLFELATAGQPRKHPVPPRLELLAQFSLRKCLRADELNLHDPDLGRFLDVKRDRRAPELLVDALLGLDLRLLVTGFLVQLFDFLRVGKEFVIVQRLAHLRLHQLEQLGVAVFPVSLKPNLAEHRLALHHVNQLHASILRTVGLYPDVAKITGRFERANIVGGRVRVVWVSNLDVNVRANEVVTDGRRADVPDFNFFNDRSRLRSRQRQPTRRQHPEQQPATASQQFHSVNCQSAPRPR